MSTNPLLATVQQRIMLKRLQSALGGKYAANTPIRLGTIVSTSQVAVNGTIYDMDSSNLGLEPGAKLNVKNVQRLAAAKFVPADAWGGAGKGGTGGAFVPHDIIGKYHTTEANAGLFVGVNPDRTLTYLDPNDWVRLWIGREEGPRLGLRKLYNDDATYTLALEAIDTANVPFFSAGAKDFVDGSEWLKLGKEGAPQIYLNAATGGMVVPLTTLASLITAGYIDLDSLAENLRFAIDASMPDALSYVAGHPHLQVAPGDSNLNVLWLKDNLDNWQLIGGAGYAFPHTHTSEETGGLLSPDTGATMEPLVFNDELLIFNHDCLMIGVS